MFTLAGRGCKSMRIKLITTDSHPLFPMLLLKCEARMQPSGIREWRSSELPGLRYAPSGLRCLDSPKEIRCDLASYRTGL